MVLHIHLGLYNNWNLSDTELNHLCPFLYKKGQTHTFAGYTYLGGGFVLRGESKPIIFGFCAIVKTKQASHHLGV